MALYKVSVWWEAEVEAEDEGYAMIEAEDKFNFMWECTAEKIQEEEDAAE